MITTTLQYYDINGNPAGRVCIQSGIKGGDHTASKPVLTKLDADLHQCMAMSGIVGQAPAGAANNMDSNRDSFVQHH